MMTDLNVIFINSSDNSKLATRVDENWTAEQVIQKLISEKFIPPLTVLNYRYILTINEGDEITAEQTFASAGVNPEDQILISFTSLAKEVHSLASHLQERTQIQKSNTLYQEAEEAVKLANQIFEAEQAKNPLKKETVNSCNDYHEEIVLVPCITDWPSLLIIAASISSIVQTLLLIIDMWSRKIEKERTQKAYDYFYQRLELFRDEEKNEYRKFVGEGQGKDLKEVKTIRVLMSDGNWIEFSSWPAEPDKLKQFIEVFNVPSASPKPLIVLFHLRNGSKVQLVVSNDLEGNSQNSQIDLFLKLLKS